MACQGDDLAPPPEESSVAGCISCPATPNQTKHCYRTGRLRSSVSASCSCTVARCGGSHYTEDICFFAPSIERSCIQRTPRSYVLAAHN
ncbi:hypothetical protein FOMPIDRAFT_1022978, partial [Fomitopsis schrenkii]